MQYVLIIESKANWSADRDVEFSRLGISDRRRRFFEALAENDLLITYVKATGFVDVRAIAAGGVKKLGLKGNYPEGGWPWQVPTRLVVNLGVENAVSPNLLSHTKLCAGQWRYRFQQSGRLIDGSDGEAIVAAMTHAAGKLDGTLKTR